MFTDKHNIQSIPIKEFHFNQYATVESVTQILKSLELFKSAKIQTCAICDMIKMINIAYTINHTQTMCSATGISRKITKEDSLNLKKRTRERTNMDKRAGKRKHVA